MKLLAEEAVVLCHIFLAKIRHWILLGARRGHTFSQRKEQSDSVVETCTSSELREFDSHLAK